MKSTLLSLFLTCSSLCLFGQTNTSALLLDGIDDRDSIPNSAGLLDGSTSMSLSVWVKPENENPAYPDFDAFAGYKNETQSDFYMVQIGATQVEARFRNTSGVAFDILFNGLVLHQWNHFVFTYDGTKTELYHNGSLVGTKTASGDMGNPGLDFMIGAIIYSDHTAFVLNGSIDEVGLWTKALTPQEITDLMACPPDGTDGDLVGYWACNDATGTNSEDLSSGDHPGILLNGATWTTTGIPTYNCPVIAVQPRVSQSEVSVYPNPFQSTASLQFNPITQPVSISLHDALGVDVTPAKLRTPGLAAKETITLEKGNLANGVYFLRIETEGKILTKKLVIGN